MLRCGIVRSRNAPAGDIAELAVARAYGGELAPYSAKSWDVVAGGRKLQVKCRVIDPARRPTQFSPFRSWEFDVCVFVLLDALTYEVTEAFEIRRDAVRGSSTAVAWVAGQRISLAKVRNHPGASDVTEKVRAAYAALPDAPEDRE